ncbi:hypothetical protein TRFO_38474 [Tritrichomonas foetus]|uniref:Uncharacterized protein n=1 Tax=Tritrichomonas foetus TaxID=1144522 RepID=A0A1J4J8H5_9EUKA|nr:hypothetical protein TRFO_38474 [Tritrichomonas foetus]|eukprot:OHS95440.1 hypothetical protein TRFO_38474 [Tritrichomonas foetus]
MQKKKKTSFSYRRGVPLNPTKKKKAVEYFERAQEVSNQKKKNEDRISQLEKECSCFREEIEAGRRMIKLEKQKIENKKRNLTMHAKTPKRDRKSGHMFSRSYFDRNNEKCHSFDDQYYLNFRRMNDFHEFDDYDHYYESNKNRQNEKNRDLFNFERNTKNRFDYSENEFNRNNYGDNDIKKKKNSNQMNKNIKHNQKKKKNYFYDDNNSDYSSFKKKKTFYNSFSSNQFSKDEEASSAFYEKYVQEEIE